MIGHWWSISKASGKILFHFTGRLCYYIYVLFVKYIYGGMILISIITKKSTFIPKIIIFLENKMIFFTETL